MLPCTKRSKAYKHTNSHTFNNKKNCKLHLHLNKARTQKRICNHFAIIMNSSMCLLIENRTIFVSEHFFPQLTDTENDFKRRTSIVYLLLAGRRMSLGMGKE